MALAQFPKRPKTVAGAVSPAAKSIPMQAVAGAVGCLVFAFILLALAIVAGGGLYAVGAFDGLGGVTVQGADEFGVMIVHESANDSKLTETQLNAMKSNADGSLRKYAEAKGTWRLYDADQDVSMDNKNVQAVFALKRDSLPWCYVWKNRKVKGFPLVDEAGAIQAAKSYGGPL